ncbi:nucleoside triphosphate hydrolase [Aureimonas sp. AU12]|uniref:nucleoside triphosphate hydrolase n=1 Tax=Aureimonas sp. AU12 TaxID=1638161 RepID=UPI0007813B8B|nr:nucleoside triphosphate hydrolase [Aureimonas sp. AU12]
MTETLTLAALADALLTEDGSARRIVAIAGSPGSGKSTAAESLKERLNARRPGVADILPMDGYHFDDAVLNARGDRSRKGAPHTFDIDGFRVMLERLRADTGCDVAVPVFDRSIEIARAGGRIVEAGTRIILAEGNYLLLDQPGWRDLAPLFDLTVMIEAREEVLIDRLTQRWLGFQLDPEAMIRQMEGNDLPNMRLVLTSSRPADVTVRSDREG